MCPKKYKHSLQKDMHIKPCPAQGLSSYLDIIDLYHCELLNRAIG